MKQRFFFNGVDIDRTRIAIDDAAKYAVYIDPDPAVTALAGRNDTFPWAQLALDLLIHKTLTKYYAVIITKLGKRLEDFRYWILDAQCQGVKMVYCSMLRNG